MASPEENGKLEEPQPEGRQLLEKSLANLLFLIDEADLAENKLAEVRALARSQKISAPQIIRSINEINDSLQKVKRGAFPLLQELRTALDASTELPIDAAVQNDLEIRIKEFIDANAIKNAGRYVADARGDVERAVILRAEFPETWEAILEDGRNYRGAEIFRGSSVVLERAVALAHERDIPVRTVLSKGLEGVRREPNEEELDSAGLDMRRTRSMINEISRHTKRATYMICNARSGLLFDYGFQSPNAQLVEQLRENGTAKGFAGNKLAEFVYSEVMRFYNEVAKDPHWRKHVSRPEGEPNPGENLALLSTAQEWMKRGKLRYFVVTDTDTKLSSGGFDVKVFSKSAKEMITDGTKFNLVFLDSSERDEPKSFYHFAKCLKEIAPGRKGGKPRTIEFPYRLQTPVGIQEAVKKFFRFSKTNVINFNASTTRNDWWDDRNPSFLGKKAAQFDSSDSRGTLVSPEYVTYPQKGAPPELFSERVKMALRCRDKDAEGRNWYRREFEAELLREAMTIPQDTSDNLERFRTWAPYETDEAGEPVLVDGYPKAKPESPAITRGAEAVAEDVARMEILAQAQEEARRSNFRVSFFGTASEEEQFEQATAMASKLSGLIVRESGFKVVTGGANVGIMKAVHEAALASAEELARNDLKPIGIVTPGGKKDGGTRWAVEGGTLEVVRDFNRRLKALVEDSQAYIACTATTGTIAEVQEALKNENGVSRRKPLIIIDPTGELQKLTLAMLEPLSKEHRLRVFSVATPTEAKEILEIYCEPHGATNAQSDYLESKRLLPTVT